MHRTKNNANSVSFNKRTTNKASKQQVEPFEYILLLFTF